GDKGIFEMIEELKLYLQNTRSSYDRIINNFIEFERPFEIDETESKLDTIKTYIYRLEFLAKKGVDSLKLMGEVNEWFKELIEEHIGLPQKESQENFKTVQDLINTLEEQLEDQKIQIKNLQEQNILLQEQIDNNTDNIINTRISLKNWQNLALSLSNTIVDCTRHNIL
ncbi:MAG TPA: hypothetical protein VJ583_08320, partial [Nitrososphaeraceae archaeon]|nr:hypothetical protein [Nitrososphaeraceae archaeon]